MFFFFITLLSLLGRRLIGDWSAISRGPVPDRSATSCIKSQRGPHEVADQSPISRRPVPDQSPTSRRRVADQLQNLVATPLRPLRSLWILVAERSQSGCSVCLILSCLWLSENLNYGSSKTVEDILITLGTCMKMCCSVLSACRQILKWGTGIGMFHIS